MPNENTSLALEGLSPRDCSGDMYRSVPAGRTELEVIVLPKNMTDPGILRNLPHLRKIGSQNPANNNATGLPDAADFWREYDAKRPAASK